LIYWFTKRGQLVVDPFAGSGTIPLEAVLNGRRTFATDISPYAAVLSQAKLFPPVSIERAISRANELLETAAALPRPDLRQVPSWVRAFFHPKTLKEIMRFVEICKREREFFLLGCALGILHHQRRGFLSFPSSHLVPYLRTRKFPPKDYPELYEYRELRPRLIAKIHRALARSGFPKRPPRALADFETTCFERALFPQRFDAVITSPPYMNALDYGRDNRLRLWFLEPTAAQALDTNIRGTASFVRLASSLADLVESGLVRGGYCVLVVGESVSRGAPSRPANRLCGILAERAPSLRLQSVITDQIPDIRRARRACGAVKTEQVLVYRREG
jgi:hypothetical protein